MELANESLNPLYERVWANHVSSKRVEVRVPHKELEATR